MPGPTFGVWPPAAGGSEVGPEIPVGWALCNTTTEAIDAQSGDLFTNCIAAGGGEFIVGLNPEAGIDNSLNRTAILVSALYPTVTIVAQYATGLNNVSVFFHDIDGAPAAPGAFTIALFYSPPEE